MYLLFMLFGGITNQVCSIVVMSSVFDFMFNMCCCFCVVDCWLSFVVDGVCYCLV